MGEFGLVSGLRAEKPEGRGENVRRSQVSVRDEPGSISAVQSED